MLALFEKYLLQGMVSEALMTGQNLFHKHSGDKEIFEKYFDLLLALAGDRDRAVEERRGYLRQAVAVLAFFSENAEFDENIVSYITGRRDQLDCTAECINSDEVELHRAVIKRKIEENDHNIAGVCELIRKLESASNTAEFDKAIKQIGQADAMFEKDYFTERQQDHSDVLTKKCSEIVDKKTRAFERKRNAEYNVKAIEAYEKIFTLFKENKIPENHLDIVKGLFAFDASRLQNETLVYYNYIYSYILGKLDDKGKFALTKYAIMSEKKCD